MPMMRYFAAAVALGIGFARSISTSDSTVLKLNIPNTAVRDEFYYVDVDFQAQTLPLLLDTGSDDILVASNECSNTNKTSGCYHSKLFQIPKGLEIKKHETFGSIVGTGSVVGNQSFMSVDFGDIKVKNLAVPLIYDAAKDEFQNGSFSGIFGIGMLNVSREYHFFQQLPPFNKMVADELLNKPVFSVTVPRYGDPASPKYGNLTLGAIQPAPEHVNVTYSDVIRTPSYIKGETTYAYQTWTQVLQGFRVNGHDVPIPQKGLGENGTYIATLDSGGEQLFVGQLFNKAANLFKGKTDIIADVFTYFDCAEPQLVEFKFNDQWIPIDPLDLIQPGGSTKMINGTEMCLATLAAGNSAYSDMTLGPQFFRNSLTVFDYVSKNLFSVPPRVGIGPLTDAQTALKRYKKLYKNRLH